MIKLLWMLYLAFTLLLTLDVLFGTLNRIYKQIKQDDYDNNLRIICVLLWSIWYFYYLH